MFVYVIGADGAKRVKIGISANPFERLSQLQTGQHRRLTIYHAAHFEGEMKARDIEGRMHDELSRWKTKMGGSEWFSTKALKWVKAHAHQQKWRDMHPACAEFCDKRFKGTPLEVQAELERCLPRSY